MAVEHAATFSGRRRRSDPSPLAEAVRRLVKAYRPERIYLFGSVARGDPGPDSDYDLLVVVPDDAPPERRRSRAWHTRRSAEPAPPPTCSYAPVPTLSSAGF